MKHTLYFSLGSNIASRLRHLRHGLKTLQEANFNIQIVSSVYRTSPVGITNQPYFLNAVAKAKTTLSPLEVLALFKKIEKRWDRGRGVRFGPRTLDLDLLLYDKIRLKTRKLTLPHSRMGSRRFVLVPLLEINPKITMPDGSRCKLLLDKCDPSQSIRLYRRNWAQL